MTTRIGRRAMAGAAALLPAAALIGPAQAQSANESTFDRIRRTKTLRIAALPGELPISRRTSPPANGAARASTWRRTSPRCSTPRSHMSNSTYGNSVLDLQSNKVDLAFALNPTPERALSIGFTHPMIVHPFGCVARKGLDPNTWDDLNKPDVRVVYDIGSLHETAAKRYCPKAQLTGYKTRDDCTLALQSGRADAHILAAILGLSAIGKNPSLGTYHLLTDPPVALPSCLGIQREPDPRFADVVNAWIDFNRGTGQIREWLLDGLAKFGVTREQIPPTLSF